MPNAVSTTQGTPVLDTRARRLPRLRLTGSGRFLGGSARVDEGAISPCCRARPQSRSPKIALNACPRWGKWRKKFEHARSYKSAFVAVECSAHGWCLKVKLSRRRD